MNIIGITGPAGSGKDECAKVLVERFSFVRIALADEMKRFLARVYGWGPGRLWGPSEQRNLPDPDLGGLTARKALQHLGTEWGRAMHENTWINLVIRDAHRIATQPVFYTPEEGLTEWFGRDGRDIYRSVVIPDVRFPNEVAAIHAVGGRVWRIDRPGAGPRPEKPLHMRVKPASPTSTSTVSSATTAISKASKRPSSSSPRSPASRWCNGEASSPQGRRGSDPEGSE